MMVLRRIFVWLFISILGLLLFLVIFLGYSIKQAEKREIIPLVQAMPKEGYYVKTQYGQIYLQEFGPLTGKAVVFVHGTGAWGGVWQHTLKALAHQGYHAFALDLPPFGYSEKNYSFTYDKVTQGARICSLIHALKLEKVVIVGHSFGAGPAVECSLNLGQKLQALILVDAALSVSENIDSLTLTDKIIHKLLAYEFLKKGITAAFLTNPTYTESLIKKFVYQKSAVTNYYIDLYKKPLNTVGFTEAVSKWLPFLLEKQKNSQSENPHAYTRLNIPVSLIWGEKDSITPLNQATNLMKWLPKGKLIVMPDVGHIPQIESGDDFDNILLKELFIMFSEKT